MTNPQSDLFGPAPRARRTDPPTSHKAAVSMVESAATQRNHALDALRAFGPMTADEIDQRLGWRDTTAGRRMNELMTQGRVVLTGEERPTRRGRPANVYAARSFMPGPVDKEGSPRTHPPSSEQAPDAGSGSPHYPSDPAGPGQGGKNAVQRRAVPRGVPPTDADRTGSAGPRNATPAGSLTHHEEAA